MSASPATLHVRDTPDRLLFRWTAEGDLFFTLRDALKRNFTASDGLHFDGTERMWCLPRRERDRFRRWADSWFSVKAQQWETMRCSAGYDSAGTDGRSGPGGAVTTAVEQALATLHLRPDAPPWAAEAVYRAAQKHLHPDAGGTHEQAVAVNQAIAVIREAQGTRSGAA